MSEHQHGAVVRQPGRRHRRLPLLCHSCRRRWQHRSCGSGGGRRRRRRRHRHRVWHRHDESHDVVRQPGRLAANVQCIQDDCDEPGVPKQRRHRRRRWHWQHGRRVRSSELQPHHDVHAAAAVAVAITIQDVLGIGDANSECDRQHHANHQPDTIRHTDS